MEHEDFADILNKYVSRAGYTSGQLAKLTGLPKPTIVSWLEGRVGRPRKYEDILQIARALRLNEDEVSHLLAAARHPTLDSLRQTAAAGNDRSLAALLAFWQLAAAKSFASNFRPFQAPPKLADFVGRTELLPIIAEALCTQPMPCVLQGMGGVGKTVLAIHIAYRVQSLFPDGVLWANLEHINGVETNDPALLSALGTFAKAYGRDVKDEISVADRSRVLREVLANKHALVVLDNALNEEVVQHFLPPSNSKCAVLITTRTRQFWGKQSVSFDVTPFSLAEGLQLFSETLGTDRTQEQQSGAAKIVTLLGGLPLALRIVTSDMVTAPEMLTFLEYYDLLLEEKSRLDYLSERDSSSRNIRASFEVSFSRLQPRLKGIFASLSIFPGSDFESASVATVTQMALPEAKRYLGHLYSRSLIEKGRTSFSTYLFANLSLPLDRFHLHTLLRLFAQEKLSEQGLIASELTRRAARHFVDLARAVPHDYDSLDKEWSNIWGVLQWTISHNEHSLLQSGIMSLTVVEVGVIGYLDARGYYYEALTLLTAATETIPLEPTLTYAVLLWKKGAFAWRLNQRELARQCLHASRKMLLQLPSTEERLMQEAYLAEFMARLELEHDKEAGMAEIEMGLAAIENLKSEAAIHQRGYLHIVAATIQGQMLGLFTEAMAAIERGFSMLPQEPTAARLSGLTTSSAIAIHTGNLDGSVQYLDQAIKIAAELGNQRQLAIAHMNMGITLQRQGNLLAAVEHCRQALEIFERIGIPYFQGATLINLGMTHIICSEDETAATYLTRAISLGEEYDLPQLEAFAHTSLAHPQIRQQQYKAALNGLKKSQAICQKYAYVDLMPSILYWQAEIARRQHDLKQALSLVNQAVEIAKQGGYTQEEGIAWSIKGRVLDDQEQLIEAETAHQNSLEKLMKQEPYELARSQLAGARHYIRRYGSLTDVARTLLEAALETLQKLGARIEVEEILSMLESEG